MNLYCIYLYVTKAFDTVSRRIMAKYGCSPKFITIVRLLDDGMLASPGYRNSSEPFLVSDGVKQGGTNFGLTVSIKKTSDAPTSSREDLH